MSAAAVAISLFSIFMSHVRSPGVAHVLDSHSKSRILLFKPIAQKNTYPHRSSTFIFLLQMPFSYLRLPLLLFLLLGKVAHAQRFQPLPGTLLTQEVALEAANECTIYFENLSGDSLRLQWRSGEVGKPEEWDIDLCDYGLCYTGIPASGTMNAISGSTRAYLKLIIQPDTIAGQTWLWFRVWEVGQDSAYVDVYFNAHTPGVVSTDAPPQEDLNWMLYPNPTQDILFLQYIGQKPDADMRIRNSIGQPIWSGKLVAGQTRTFSVSHWPRGLYFVDDTNGHTKQLLLH